MRNTILNRGLTFFNQARRGYATEIPEHAERVCLKELCSALYSNRIKNIIPPLSKAAFFGIVNTPIEGKIPLHHMQLSTYGCKYRGENALAILQLLIRAGSDLDNLDPTHGHLSILHKVIESDNCEKPSFRLEMIRCLINSGVDVNQPSGSKYLYTPLSFATIYNDIEVAELLLRKGAQPSLFLRDLHGTTPAEKAESRGYNELMEILRDAEAEYKRSSADTDSTAYARMTRSLF